MSTNEEFYKMDIVYSNTTRPMALKNEYEGGSCPKCGAVNNRRLSTLKVKFIGKKPVDFYTIAKYHIISKRFQDVLIESKIKDFRLKDIFVEGWYDSNDNELDIDWSGLKEIEITGRCGYLRHLNGELVDKCNECNAKDYKKQHLINGLSVNIDEWDKSDIFYFKNWEGPIIVTNKVKELIEKNKFTNIVFTNIKDIKFN